MLLQSMARRGAGGSGLFSRLLNSPLSMLSSSYSFRHSLAFPPSSSSLHSCSSTVMSPLRRTMGSAHLTSYVCEAMRSLGAKPVNGMLPFVIPGSRRMVAGFTSDGRVVGNMLEAWEKREVEKIVKTRNPKLYDDFEVGDFVVVRCLNPLQPTKYLTFGGVCLAKKNGLLSAGFTLRNIVAGVGVERMFKLYSPTIMGIRKIGRTSLKVKRSKIYYVRTLASKFSTINFSEKTVTLPQGPPAAT